MRFAILSMLWFCATIYALFLAPQNQTVPPFPHFDKVVHAALFFTQTWLWVKTYWALFRPLPIKMMMTILVLWAIISEVMQATLTTTRHGDVWDVIADVTGIILALLLAKRVEKAKQNQTISSNKAQ